MLSRETAQIVLEHVVPEVQKGQYLRSYSWGIVDLPLPTVHPKKQNANSANRMDEAPFDPVL